jgi:hypothetical protein
MKQSKVFTKFIVLEMNFESDMLEAEFYGK